MFFKVVKAAFGKRRKTILNSLYNSELGLEKEIIKEILEKSHIPLEERAENLKIKDFIKISKTLAPP